MCKRYGILPSQALKMGNTIDIRCAIVAIEYENYLHTKTRNGKAPVKEPSQEEMMAMMKAVRNKQ